MRRSRSTRTPGVHRDELSDRFRYRGDGGFANVRLSRVLSYYERFCWFPDMHVNYAGLLSREGFSWGLQHGLMPKDPGAQAKHGDFSHRLQWHAIMRIATENFTTPLRPGWRHTPLELFVSLGRAPAAADAMWSTCSTTTATADRT